MLRRSIFAVVVAGLLTTTSYAQLSSYSADFESSDINSVSALDDLGWRVYGNVFNDAGDFLYNYGPTNFPAPNSTADNNFRFSALVENEGSGGGSQGTVQLGAR